MTAYKYRKEKQVINQLHTYEKMKNKPYIV